MQGVKVNTDLDLPYDYEDFGMSAEELKAKYERKSHGEHPEHTLEGWRSGPADEGEDNGYWDWVYRMVQQDEEQY